MASELWERVIFMGAAAGMAAAVLLTDPASEESGKNGSSEISNNIENEHGNDSSAPPTTPPRPSRSGVSGHANTLTVSTESDSYQVSSDVVDTNANAADNNNNNENGGNEIYNNSNDEARRLLPLVTSPSRDHVRLVSHDVSFFPLRSRKRINHNTVFLSFELPFPDRSLHLPTGHHLTVCVNYLDPNDDDSNDGNDANNLNNSSNGNINNGGDREDGDMVVVGGASSPGGRSSRGKIICRAYTPISTSSALGHFDLLVKVYPGGIVSSFLGSIQVGDVVAFSGPKGRFTYKRGEFRSLGMIAGGTGVTPMLQILRQISEDETDTTEVSLVYANVTEEDILLRDEIDAIVRSRPEQFKVYYVLNDPPARWNGGIGFVTLDVLRERMPEPADNIRLLMCGPPPMVKAMAGHAKALGYGRRMIYKF